MTTLEITYVPHDTKPSIKDFISMWQEQARSMTYFNTLHITTLRKLPLKQRKIAKRRSKHIGKRYFSKKLTAQTLLLKTVYPTGAPDQSIETLVKDSIIDVAFSYNCPSNL